MIILLVSFAGISFSETHQVRALWVIRHNLTSSKKVKEIVEFAEKNGFTDLYVQVRGRGDAYYRSTIVPLAAPLQKSPGFDPLKEIIVAARGKNIRIHAWFNVFLLWSFSDKPKSSHHIFNSHVHWIEQTLQGILSYRQLQNMGVEGFYLSPALPEVRDHLFEVIKELFNNYKLDGIHFDYIRYGGMRFGYHPVNRENFRRLSGHDPAYVIERLQRKLSPSEHKELYNIMKSWDDFRASQISQFLELVYPYLKSIDPGIVISAAVKPDLQSAREKYYQYWDKWLREGLLDYVVIMNYSESKSVFLENIRSFPSDISRSKCVVGISLYDKNVAGSVRQILEYNKMDFKGISLFSYDNLKKNKLLSKAVKKNISKKNISAGN